MELVKVRTCCFPRPDDLECHSATEAIFFSSATPYSGVRIYGIMLLSSTGALARASFKAKRVAFSPSCITSFVRNLRTVQDPTQRVSNLPDSDATQL